jgi:hypothetical protein
LYRNVYVYKSLTPWSLFHIYFCIWEKPSECKRFSSWISFDINFCRSRNFNFFFFLFTKPEKKNGEYQGIEWLLLKREKFNILQRKRNSEMSCTNGKFHNSLHRMERTSLRQSKNVVKKFTCHPLSKSQLVLKYNSLSEWVSEC